MFGVDEASKFNSLHGFVSLTKHEKIPHGWEQSTNILHGRFLIGRPKMTL